MSREKTKFTGVYRRVSDTRRHNGKPDICFDINHRDSTGRLVWEKVGWASEGYTAQMASDIRGERIRIERHTGVLPERRKKSAMTMGDAWAIFKEKWLPNLAHPRDEESRYTCHIAPRFSSTPLDRITPLALETFKQELLGKGLAPASARLILGDIRRIYRKLISWNLYSGTVPTDGLKMPRADNARIRYLTPDEAERLLDALKTRSPSWWRMAMISLHTGMRIGEILSLRGSDINLPSRVVHVRDAKAGTRMAHMTDAVAPVFEDVMPATPDGLLFCSREGKPLRVTDTSNTFAKVIKTLGFNDGLTDRRQKVVFHTLRHTFCSWLAIQGVPLYTIGELVGHSSLEMTKRYSHLCPDTKRKAISHVEVMAQNGKPPMAAHSS
ncbi:site-specific integrase [Desulfovibrio sp. JY]|nr:site-specific integrase [Desulfovibrio sp. JY]